MASDIRNADLVSRNVSGKPDRERPRKDIARDSDVPAMTVPAATRTPQNAAPVSSVPATSGASGRHAMQAVKRGFVRESNREVVRRKSPGRSYPSRHVTQRPPSTAPAGRSPHQASPFTHMDSRQNGGPSSGDFLPSRRENTNVGELLTAIVMVTDVNLEKDLLPVVRDGMQRGVRPVRALLHAGIITETVAAQLIAHQVGTISIEPMSITTEAADVLPLWFCEQHKVVPVSLIDDVLTVASTKTLQSLLKVEIEEIAQRPVLYRLTSDESISACLAFLATNNTGEDTDSIASETINESVANWQTLIAEDDSDADVANLVVSLMTRAIALNASDIHIQTEMTEAGTTVVTSHLRRLGDLVKHSTYSPDRGYRLINRLKVAGGFDVDSTKPCDGRYDIAVPGSGRYDLRLVGMPLSRGQMLVLRLLPHFRKDRKDVSDIFPAKYSDLTERITRIMQQPEGMALVVGSTGSGKSTTLAAMLRPLAQDPALKVVTVEDPVESLIIGAQQVQVTKRLSFADALRGFLRSDPDAILVGEIRDAETAKMAIQAAQTGHMVLSTLHASTVELTPSRLYDMGVPRSILADVLNCVISNRLVKTLCTACSSGRANRDPAPRGCTNCSDTGWGGRIAIAELMEITPEVASLIVEDAPVGKIREAANIYSYSQYAAKLIDAGITTREAVIRQLGNTYDPSFETDLLLDDVGDAPPPEILKRSKNKEKDKNQAQNKKNDQRYSDQLAVPAQPLQLHSS